MPDYDQNGNRRMGPPRRRPGPKNWRKESNTGHSSGDPRKRWNRTNDDRRREEMREQGGPFREGYNSDFYDPADRPDPGNYGRPWQGGVDENRSIHWEHRDDYEGGGWESNEFFQEYNRNIDNIPGYFPQDHRTPDEHIRGDIYELLANNPQVFTPDINVRVRDGYVLLEGYARTPGLRRRIEQIAHMVRGVRGVENRIRVD